MSVIKDGYERKVRLLEDRVANVERLLFEEREARRNSEEEYRAQLRKVVTEVRKRGRE